ncbi:MAG: T9SS type A sorting domain-containing protein [Bacteroidota bacterium]
MKKLIFTAFIAAATMVQAQQAVKSGSVKNSPFTSEAPSPMKKNTLGKSGTVSEWYSYPTFLQDAQLLGTSGSVAFMAHDSLAKYINTGDSIEYDRQLLAMGSVLDPKDDVIDNSQNPGLKLTKYTSYTVDSLAFRYLYCRYADSTDDGLGGKKFVVDTLFIFSFKTPAIKERTSGTKKYANMDWNTATRYPVGYSSIDTVLLTNADTSTLPDAGEQSWFTKIKEFGFKTPIEISKVTTGVANNLFGFVGVFKSGIVYDTSYTFIHAGTGAKPTKRINYFGMRSWADDAAVPYENTTFYNTSLYSPTFVAYPNTQNYFGLQAGSIYTRTLYLDAFYKVNSSNTALKDIKNDNFTMTNVYPNPANANGTAVMAFNLKTASTVSINIMNIAGQQVKSVLNQNFAAGEHAQEFELSGLNAGIYMVNMTVNGVTMTKKLTITE